jgi:hypothetical protein
MEQVQRRAQELAGDPYVERKPAISPIPAEEFFDG